VQEKIGSGGMGDVYRAWDTRLEREVALKLVADSYLLTELGSGSPSSHAGTPHSRTHLSHERFLREARSAATLSHPNICAIFDVGEQDGRPYLVMELLRGETLKSRLEKGALTADEVVVFSREAASALVAAHAKGVIHRDIKPANFFVNELGRKKQIKMLDFGLAKRQGAEASADSRTMDAGMPGGGSDATAATGMMDLTSPGSTVGTVAYMSPEQAKGDPLDARTDLFSLGTVIYEMATGRKAFEGKSTAEVFAALLMKEPPALSGLNAAMPSQLDAITAKLLAKEKEQRYASAEDLLEDLEALPVGGTGSGSRATASGGVSQATGTYAVASGVHSAQSGSTTTAAPPGTTGKIIAAVVVLLLLAGGGFAWWKHKSPGPAGGTTAPDVTAGAAAKNAIIVADFVNQTGDPVFDATLNQALVVQLGQSPVLSIVSQRHLHQSLQYLGKKGDTVITPEIAREIGEREGIKAILTGTISNLGGDYVITLAAQNTATGDQIASVQTQAASKDKVLDALNQAAAQMRAKLGESLDSIQKLNAPFGQATTPSLEAFRAYALGDAAHARGNDIPEAEGHYKRALELDPKLAMAWARLGVVYLNSGQAGKAEEYFTRAHELSADVSERERLYIEGHYYSEVVGDLDKAVETLEVAVQEYPLQLDNYINLGVLYRLQGHLDKSQAMQLKGLAVQPDDAIALGNLIVDYAQAGQPEEAEKYLAKAKQLGLNGTDILTFEIILDGTKGDMDGIQKILAASAGRPDAFIMWSVWARFQEFGGQLQGARKSYRKAAEMAAAAKATDAEARYLLNEAEVGSWVQPCQDPEGAVKRALELNKTKPTQIAVAETLSACGVARQATEALDALEKKYPEDTRVQQLDVPEGRGVLALDAKEPQKALDFLAKAQQYDLVSPGPYLRGLAYLQLKDAQNAIAAFKIATARKFGSSPYGLSQLGLGRAYAMAGDKADAKKAYEAFFAAWKDADPGLQVVADAKKEYAAL
jgi:tetratricopeptide (TPR) repeat protein